MADLDLATRRRLADALAGADAETLRKDADLTIWNALSADWMVASERFLRLAALALAVAEMQERGYGIDAANYGPDGPTVWFDTNERQPDEDSQIHTLPAALAALLDTEAR